MLRFFYEYSRLVACDVSERAELYRVVVQLVKK